MYCGYAAKDMRIDMWFEAHLRQDHEMARGSRSGRACSNEMTLSL